MRHHSFLLAQRVGRKVWEGAGTEWKNSKNKNSKSDTQFTVNYDCVNLKLEFSSDLISLLLLSLSPSQSQPTPLVFYFRNPLHFYLAFRLFAFQSFKFSNPKFPKSSFSQFIHFCFFFLFYRK